MAEPIRRTIFQVEVLTLGDQEYDPDTLHQIAEDIVHNDIGNWSRTDSVVLEGQAAVDAIWAMGSDPEFFGFEVDDEGNLIVAAEDEEEDLPDPDEDERIYPCVRCGEETEKCYCPRFAGEPNMLCANGCDALEGQHILDDIRTPLCPGSWMENAYLDRFEGDQN